MVNLRLGGDLRGQLLFLVVVHHAAVRQTCTASILGTAFRRKRKRVFWKCRRPKTWRSFINRWSPAQRRLGPSHRAATTLVVEFLGEHLSSQVKKP